MQRCLKNASFRYDPRGRGGARGRFVGIDLFGTRWGFDRSTVYVGPERYLDRWILYVWGYTLRVHRFWRGDDDRASHTHPWWFVTFPLSEYVEKRFCQGQFSGTYLVRAFRPHFRSKSFEHYVLSSYEAYEDQQVARSTGMRAPVAKPFWTLVITGRKNNTWGFYPAPGKFVNWKDYE